MFSVEELVPYCPLYLYHMLFSNIVFSLPAYCPTCLYLILYLVCYPAPYACCFTPTHVASFILLAVRRGAEETQFSSSVFCIALQMDYNKVSLIPLVLQQ